MTMNPNPRKPLKAQLEDIIVELAPMTDETHRMSETYRATRIRIIVMKLKDALADAEQLQDDLKAFADL